MKHVTYSEKSLLMGDTVADLLMEYATVLGREGGVDNVTVRAVGHDGNDADATFLLGPGIILMIETAGTNLPEPDNTAAVRYIADRLHELTHPTPAQVGADEDEGPALDVPGDY